MPKRILPLSDKQVENAKHQAKDMTMFDGGGLYLLIGQQKYNSDHKKLPASKLWRFKYRFGGKEKLLAFGSYPEISLADARERREDARKLIAKGVDPGAVKRAQKAADISKHENSFEVIARIWQSKKATGWSDGNSKSAECSGRNAKAAGWSESHANTTLQRLEKNIFPWLGKMPVSDIQLCDIKSVLQRIEERAPESARRMYVALNMIFRYCVVSDYIKRNPMEGLTPKDILTREPIERHLPALIQPKELAPFLRAIDDFKCSFIVKCAFQLAPLVFVRPGDLRHAEWKEIDFELDEWNIPVEKMKLTKKEKNNRAGQFHCVPLCKQSIEILKAIQPLTERSPYVFPGARSNLRPMSEAALTAAIHRMGYKGEMTWHGFRAVARTMLDEVLKFRPDFIEHQLAHAVKDAQGRAYNRTTHLAERRKMMQTWADYLDSLKSGTKVIQLCD
jgi:integrase